MPRFNGSGPKGEGPLTGRGAGNCAPNATQSNDANAYGEPQAGPMGMNRFARWLNPLRWFGMGGRRNRRNGRRR